MANKLDSTSLFNPVAFWTDLGLRGLEMTLSSTQNISEGVERLARAGASAAASEQVASPIAASSEPVRSLTSSGLEVAAQMQKTTFDLMTRVWRQWMSAFGTLASLGSRGGETLARQNPWLSVMPGGLQPGGEGDIGHSASGSRRHQSASRRKDHTESAAAMEHALATGETKRRSRGGHAKSKPRSRSR